MREDKRGLWCMLVVMVLVAMLVVSCKTHEVNTHVVTDTLYVAKHTRDSIYIRDSVSRTEKTVLDTVYIETSKWKTEYRERLVRDTIYQSVTDRVYTETKVYPTTLEKAKTAALWMLVGMAVAVGIRIARKILI